MAGDPRRIAGQEPGGGRVPANGEGLPAGGFHRIRAGASDVKRPLEEAIAEVLGQRYAVRLEDASAGAAQPAPAGADPLEEALRRARVAGIPVREE